MGQTESTLGSLLNMYGYDDPEGLGKGEEEATEARLLQARQELICAIRTGTRDSTQALSVLLDLRWPVSMKYAHLNIKDLLSDNCQSIEQLKTIPTALSMLEKYGRHLLKPLSARVSQWRQINFNNSIFKDRVLPMQGALELVQQMGYSQPTEDGLLFADEEPDPEVTSQLVADILLARTEIERYLLGKHPHSEIIHALLPESTVDQTVQHWEHTGSSEAGTAAVNPLPFDASLSSSTPLFNTPTPVSVPVEGETEKVEAEQGREGLPTAESAAGEMDRTMSSSLLFDSLQKACDICGETAASLWCGMCDNKQLCGMCDDMWHKHPKRQNHHREPIASLPSPSIVTSQDAIRGPFGIRALSSLSGERSPTPVSSGHSRTPPPAPSRTPPPQQIEAEASIPADLMHYGAGSQQAGGPQASPSAPQPVSPTSFLYQHHQQQLQLYQHQQRMQQQQQQREQQQHQQQRLLQQQKEFGFVGGVYPMPPSYGQSVAMEGASSAQQRAVMYPSVAVNPTYQPHPNAFGQQQNAGYPNETAFHHSAYNPASAGLAYPTSVALPPFPVLDPDPLSAGGPVAVSPNQRTGQAAHPDLNLKGGAMTGGGAGGYTDMSLRHTPTQRGVESGGGGGGKGGVVPPASIPVSAVFGAGGSRLERRQSGHHLPGSMASVSESSLLKTVLAETDYEKRAAKCDVRLLTLEEDLQEVETQLNDLMLRDEDVTECDDFRTLNRRKARLMKEHRALRDYRQELAHLMSAEAPPPSSDRGPRPTTQIYHPPPLGPSAASSPSPSFPLPVSTSPTQQHLGFSYPHQASQSPVNPQEPQPISVYRQPLPHSGAQSPVSYPFPAMQESSSYHNVPVNSSVDRSSIFSHWQMVQPTAVSSPPSSAPFYPPPRYQEGAGDSSTTMALPSALMFGQEAGGQWSQAGEQNALGQSRGRMPVAQEHGMPPSQHLPPGGKDLLLYGQQNVSRQKNTDVHYGTVDQGMAPQIGFENFMTLELNAQHSPFQAGRTPSTASDPGMGPPPQHPPPRMFQQSGRTHTPSPPPYMFQQSARTHTPSPPRLSGTSPPQSLASVARKEAPSQQWACSHCTLINQPGTRVCTMCDRTSDNPTLISGTAASASAYSAAQRGLSPFSSSTSSSQGSQAEAMLMMYMGEAVAGGVGGVETGAPTPNMQQLTQVQRALAEEQDKVYLEKKEAHQQFNLSKQLPQSPSPTPAPTPPPATSSSTATPPPLPPRKKTASPHPPLPPRTYEGGGEDEGSSVDREEGAVRTSMIQHPHPAVPSPGGGDSPQVNSLESSFLLAEEDFSITLERFQEQKQMKQVQLDGADLMHFLKMGDREGFTMEELEAGLKQNEGSPREALQWLQKEWSKLVQVVMASTKAEGQRLDHNDVGELSTQEAKGALCEAKGDMMAAVKSCVAKRKQLYQSLNPQGSYAREEVLQAMLQSLGDEGRARHTLHTALLLPFLQRVWANQQQEAGASSTLLQMSDMSADRNCQSVSTSIISHPDFQSTIMDQNIDRERRIRMILVEGKLKSWGRAEMVIKLLDVDLPQAYPPLPLGGGGAGGGAGDRYPPYTLEDVVEAVRSCQDRQSALVYLTQECSTCFSNYPMGKIRSLNFCQCKMCDMCLKQNFEVVIREKHVRHWTCPICSHPDLNNADVASEYLGFLGLLLQTQVDREVYELFETKVRDWHLQKDPNFRWCAHCGNGFIADEHLLRMVCPHCYAKTCYSCKKQWEDQHEGLTCAQFEQWKIDNDPNNQAMGLARHLEENGIDCPSCKMRYALAKGGCMHFKCPQCGHEFCSGCCQPFYQRGMCASSQCKVGGLHAHHPRDCFFYLRDEDIPRLQNLLQESSVGFNTDSSEGQGDVSHCPVIEQKEFDSGRSDESCGKETEQGHAGLCSLHYKEYLVGLINKNHIDPVMAMTVEELKTLLKRLVINCPKASNSESEANFRKRLIKLVKDKCPLPNRGP